MPAEVPFDVAGESRISLRFAPNVIALTCLVALLLVLAPRFFLPGNLVNLLRQVAVTGIIAGGMTIVLVGRGFDLSVGGMAALGGVLAVEMARKNVAAGILVSLLVGCGGGFLNGWLATRWSINPLIATLGTRYLFYAAAAVVSSGFTQVSNRPLFLRLGKSWGMFPIPVLVFLVLTAGLYVLLRYSVWGAKVVAVGSSERAALFSGVRTHAIRIQTYALSGLCAALAGVVLAMRSGAAAPDAGSGYELDAIAAAVVGGVSLSGGSGGLLNMLAGLLLLGMMNNVLVLARQPYEVQRMVTGAAIVLAVAVDQYRRSRAR